LRFREPSKYIFQCSSFSTGGDCWVSVHSERNRWGSGTWWPAVGRTQGQIHPTRPTTWRCAPQCRDCARLLQEGSRDNPPRKVPYYRLRPIHFGH
jgi:hypothetical protein